MHPKAYYNEHDPKAAAWLRELIKAGLIADGDVDERSIVDIHPSDLEGYTQAHFFAGIGGWSYALRLGGWPDDRPVWTGSCPCQPFSAAGKQLGITDERHLWPVFCQLIAKRNPATVFGEQVASKLGREWLAGIRADLEGLGYAVGAADLCASCVGAPHIRQRLYWVADATSSRRSGLGDANEPGSQGRRLNAGEYGNQRAAWSASELIHCTDGKSRRVESGTFPLAHGVSGRVGLLRGYGNAIVPQVAAEFIKAFCEAIEGSAP